MQTPGQSRQGMNEETQSAFGYRKPDLMKSDPFISLGYHLPFYLATREKTNSPLPAKETPLF
jgi:hypothetical protein